MVAEVDSAVVAEDEEVVAVAADVTTVAEPAISPVSAPIIRVVVAAVAEADLEVAEEEAVVVEAVAAAPSVITVAAWATWLVTVVPDAEVAVADEVVAAAVEEIAIATIAAILVICLETARRNVGRAEDLAVVVSRENVTTAVALDTSPGIVHPSPLRTVTRKPEPDIRNRLEKIQETVWCGTGWCNKKSDFIQLTFAGLYIN